MSPRIQPRQEPHACPGGCGTQVPHRLLACRSCWWLLPAELRDEITRLRGQGRMANLAAVGRAVVWLKDNVTGGVPRDDE